MARPSGSGVDKGGRRAYISGMPVVKKVFKRKDGSIREEWGWEHPVQPKPKLTQEEKDRRHFRSRSTPVNWTTEK